MVDDGQGRKCGWTTRISPSSANSTTSASVSSSRPKRQFRTRILRVPSESSAGTSPHRKVKRPFGRGVARRCDPRTRGGQTPVSGTRRPRGGAKPACRGRGAPPLDGETGRSARSKCYARSHRRLGGKPRHDTRTGAMSLRPGTGPPACSGTPVRERRRSRPAPTTVARRCSVEHRAYPTSSALKAHLPGGPCQTTDGAGSGTGQRHQAAKRSRPAAAQGEVRFCPMFWLHCGHDCCAPG